MSSRWLQKIQLSNLTFRHQEAYGNKSNFISVLPQFQGYLLEILHKNFNLHLISHKNVVT